MAWREHVTSLLSLVNLHGVSAVKVSSIKQAKDILLSVEPTYASEFFPYLVELQHTPEPLVRRIILETIEEMGWKSMEHLPILMPVIVAYLRDGDHRIVRKSILIGTHLFRNVLAEMCIQLQRRGKVDWWAEELWKWLRRFRDSVLELALQSCVTGIKILSLKFLELNVLLFTAEPNEVSKSSLEGKRQVFNISWLPHSSPILNPIMLKSDSVKFLGILLNFLQPPNIFPGPITIQVVNSLTAIARKRPVHYGIILSALLECMSSFDKTKRWHASSVQYSLRTAFLGFLRCTCPDILETRERLHRALRMLNAGEAADQVIRQVDKIIKINERSSRERIGKDEGSGQDQLRKRYAPINEELDNSQETSAKKARFPSSKTVRANGPEKEIPPVNGSSLSVPVLDSDLTPAEKMIAMIGALLAEGERGAESLELLVSTFHPDLLADIVIVNMNHFAKVLPLASTPDTDSSANHSRVVQSTPTQKQTQLTAPIEKGTAPVPSSDTSSINNPSADTKRDSRRDPRRLDPRRMHSATVTTTEALVDGVASPSVSYFGSNKANKSEGSSRDGILTSMTAQTVVEDVAFIRGVNKNSASNSGNESSYLRLNSQKEVNGIAKLPDTKKVSEASASADCDDLPLSPSASYSSAMEDAEQCFPESPQYVEMNEIQQKSVAILAIERMIDSYICLQGNSCNRIRLTLLSRFIALNNADDDTVKILQNHIAIDRLKKGHDLVLHVLYQLYSFIVQESVEFSNAADAYEKILLTVAKSLLDILPPSDKSLNRLLNEVPFFPESVFTLLDSLCCSYAVDKAQGKETLDSERVTQGLGAVWALIVGRPNIRKNCLNIALKCASHAQEDIRAKAIRLVANKLYQLEYITDSIEEFASNLLYKVVHQNASEAESPQDQTLKEDNSQPEARIIFSVTLPEAQRHMSLYFALCMKKPLLLRQIFHVYGCSPKTVKQVIHRHVPIVVRSLGSNSAELLHIISDPPDRCDNLLMQVLQILTEDESPSKELIETVKGWFTTSVKDVMILIPILSFLPKDEVLPVFPRLVNLETEKFQMALAHILQGSANTGPALTPSEVLVAIHAINPERDGLPLKKITDACTTCFEQRTVFTQQVLEKALNQMVCSRYSYAVKSLKMNPQVDQTPLPLLFMRTVIQAIDAFPSLVDFVMEILSKLVARQVWKMPKLWVGFLKCVSQTQPHSFPVLMKLPPQQLEMALNKHANLKPPLGCTAALEPSLPSDSPSEANQN